MSASSSNTPRILTRGETTQFKVSFFFDQNETTPLEPIDPGYPKYTIIAPDGTPVQQGVGNPTTPGRYTAQYLVPKDAALSYNNQKPNTYNDQNQGMPLTADEARYRIEWIMVTSENYQVNFIEEFDVRDTAITQSANRELKYLTLKADPIRLMFRNTVIPYRTRMRMLIRGNDANPVLEDFLEPSRPEGQQGGIKAAKDGDSYVLYRDVPEGVTLGNTCYIILWQIQETEFSVPTTEYQMVTSITTNILPVITSLRMLIDRFQKRLGRVRAFEDSDLLEYIARGTQLVNNAYPTTGYAIDSMPDQLLSFILLAAGWYGLQAQQILDGDMNINFSGQSVTLSLDSRSAMDSAASAMMEIFNKDLTPAKMALVRRSRGMGTVAIRGYSYRNMNDFVFRVGSQNGMALGNNFLSLLGKIGLL